jgi:transmembrane sensor
MRPAKITVSVLEGAVRVDEQLQPAARGVPVLSKGEAIAIDTAPARDSPLPPAKLIPVQANRRRIDDWRAQRLEFVDEPLGQAVEEFNRYSTTHVAIGSPSLESVHVNGLFRIGDVKGFLFSLRTTLGVGVVESPGQVTLVR